jgi:3-hydroxyacyl-CoA dehydrogenase
VLFDLVLDPAKATRIALARADQCSEEAWQGAVGLFQAAGFTVTRLDDVPGMAVMRTVAMLANEAADAVNQGVCSARAVDIAMQKGVNYPRGPLAWADAVGLRHIAAVLHNLAASVWRRPLPRVAAVAPQAGGKPGRSPLPCSLMHKRWPNWPARPCTNATRPARSWA